MEVHSQKDYDEIWDTIVYPGSIFLRLLTCLIGFLKTHLNNLFAVKLIHYTNLF